MSNNIGTTDVAEGQSQKEVTINDADHRIDSALTEFLDSDYTSGNITLTTSEFQQAVRFNTTNLTVPRSLTIPSVKKLFIVDNTDGSDVVTITKGSTTIALAAGEAGIFYTDATTNHVVQIGGGGGVSTWLALSDTDPASFSGEASKTVTVNSGETGLEFTTPPYDIGMFLPGVPTNSQLLLQYVFDRAVDFPDEFAGAQGLVGTNPTAIATIDVKKGGSSIGTISISTGGVVTFVTAGGAVESFVAGDKLELIAQASADATLSDVSITFSGVRI